MSSSEQGTEGPGFHRWRPHPWHGLDAGAGAPAVVRAFIEITPFTLVKYELDKESGFLRVDRPQRSSSAPPAPYGFVPQTYCGERVRALCPGATRGDGDPLDICVISERPIDVTEVLLDARVLGGMQMLDGGEADDKIIGVLANDDVWADAQELDDLPSVLVERLRHYFSTYKLVPGGEATTEVREPYGREHAQIVIEAAQADYAESFGA